MTGGHVAFLYAPQKNDAQPVVRVTWCEAKEQQTGRLGVVVVVSKELDLG